MFGQEYITKSTFSQLFAHFVLSKTAARVEILSLCSIQNSFVFNVFEVVLEILCSIGVEQSQGVEIESFFDIIE